MGQKKQLITWTFLAFWVLLMNLGPSLHRAHFFGFHCCGSSAHQNHGHSSAASGGCHKHNGCCHHEVDVSRVDDYQIAGNSDCAFCRFFDQYNVVLVEVYLEYASVPVNCCDWFRGSLIDPSTLDPLARGPPADTLA